MEEDGEDEGSESATREIQRFTDDDADLMNILRGPESITDAGGRPEVMSADIRSTPRRRGTGLEGGRGGRGWRKFVRAMCRREERVRVGRRRRLPLHGFNGEQRMYKCRR